MAAETTVLQPNEVMTYLEKRYLERSKKALVNREGLQKGRHSTGSGKSIIFNRYTPLAAATTALTEGSNPSEVSVTSSQITATLAEYGTTVKVSKLLNLTSIDVDGAEKVDLVAQNMGETIDTLARDAMFSGATAQLAGGKSALTDVAVTDTFDAAEIAKATRTLEGNNAPKYSDGFYMGKVGPYTKFDLIQDPTYVNAKTYSDVKDLYLGEMGELYGVRLLLSTNQKTETSTVTVYSNFIHGDHAVGEKDLERDMPKLYIKVPTASDTSNPADRYSTIAWAGTYVAKTLIAEWLVNVKSGATA